MTGEVPTRGQLSSSPVTVAGANHRTARLVAIVAGLLGSLLAIATPFLPVTQTTATINWPQNGVMQSVDAPLIGYVPTDMNVTIPCRAVAGLMGIGPSFTSPQRVHLAGMTLASMASPYRRPPLARKLTPLSPRPGP